MMFDIITIGSATLDVFLKSSRLPLTRDDVGRKVEIEESFLSSGGGGTNVAAGLARLGLKTACVARFGDDLFGQRVLEDLKKEPFDQKYLIEKKGDGTDYSTILVGPDGGRTILVYRGKTKITKDLFPWQALGETKWLYLASMEGNVDLLAEVVERAREKGINIVLNPGSRELREKEKIELIFPKLKALVLNKGEADDFGLFEENLGKKVPEMTVVTNGGAGAYLFSKNKRLYAEAFESSVVDETGAGDAFSSGFVSGLIKGFSLEDSLKLGMANGVSVVGKMGTKTGLLGENDIQDWLGRKLRIEQIS